MQNKPNLLDAQMNVRSLITVDYKNKSNWKLGENKPNTKPICLPPATKQTQSNPISKEAKPWAKYATGKASGFGLESGYGNNRVHDYVDDIRDVVTRQREGIRQKQRGSC